jgi:hypothetical protein
MKFARSRLVGFMVGAPWLLTLSCAAPPNAGKGATNAAAAPAPSTPVAQFTAHFDRANHRLAIDPPSATAASASKIVRYSVDPIPIDQTGGPLPPPNNVDLVSTNCIDSYPAAQTFQCDVELRSTFTRALTNVYVQITSVTLNGAAITGYDGTNSDSYNSLGLDPTHGLWGYTNASEDPNAISGVLTSEAAGFNTGTRTWVFDNTADQNIDYAIAVFASEGFSSYDLSGPNPSLAGYVDACSGGTSITTSPATNIALPFDFTIYNTNTTSLNVAFNGQITFGTTALTTSSVPSALPSAAAPAPVFFPFWDDIGASTTDGSAQICYQTIGTAPNRQFVLEWSGLDFLNAPGGPNLGANLDFEVFLFEGTSEIDTVYNAMTGDATSDGRENGALATVGLQDETGTIATAEYQSQSFGTGFSWGYLPSP